MLGADVLALGLAGAALVLACTAVVALAVVHSVRRRWLRARSHPAVRTVASLWSASRATAAWTSRRVVAWRGGPLGLAGAQLWPAVGQAEEAVRSAEAAGAAVGDLPGLCRRLRRAAAEVDRVIEVGRTLPSDRPETAGVRQQLTDVLAAAASIRTAAIAAAADVTALRVQALADDADRELHSVTAGIARSRGVFPPEEA